MLSLLAYLKRQSKACSSRICENFFYAASLAPKVRFSNGDRLHQQGSGRGLDGDDVHFFTAHTCQGRQGGKALQSSISCCTRVDLIEEILLEDVQQLCTDAGLRGEEGGGLAETKRLANKPLGVLFLLGVTFGLDKLASMWKSA